jgi:hypothetical protein
MVHLRDPVTGIVIPGELDELSGTTTHLQGAHNRFQTVSTLGMVHPWIVLQIIGMIDETNIHKSS